MQYASAPAPSIFTVGLRTRVRADSTREARHQRALETHYNQILERRIRGLRLPSEFSEGSLIARFREIDSQEPTGGLLRKLVETNLEFEDLSQTRASGKGAGSLLKRGRILLKQEVALVGRRIELLRAQRLAQGTWANVCLMKGDFDAPQALTIGISYAVETLGHALIEGSLGPSARASSRLARSRHDVDACLREYRAKVSGALAYLDALLTARERVLILIDTWNLSDLNELYRAKPWIQAKVDRRELTSVLNELQRQVVIARRCNLELVSGTELRQAIGVSSEQGVSLARDLYRAQTAEAED